MNHTMNTAQQEITSFRFHARGGQGAKTAAQLFAETALACDHYIQAFPDYGPERRGAPIRTYVRLSKDPILLHCAVESPDYVIVLDKTLACDQSVASGMGKNSKIIVNTDKDPEEIRTSLCLTKNATLVTLDASGIAEHFIGKNIPNVVMLGALIRLSDFGNLESLKEALEKNFSKHWGKEMTEKNYLSARQGYEEVK